MDCLFTGDSTGLFIYRGQYWTVYLQRTVLDCLFTADSAGLPIYSLKHEVY